MKCYDVCSYISIYEQGTELWDFVHSKLKLSIFDDMKKDDKPYSSWLYTSFSHRNDLKITTADAIIFSFWIFLFKTFIFYFTYQP